MNIITIRIAEPTTHTLCFQLGCSEQRIHCWTTWTTWRNAISTWLFNQDFEPWLKLYKAMHMRFGVFYEKEIFGWIPTCRMRNTKSQRNPPTNTGYFPALFYPHLHLKTKKSYVLCCPLP